MSLKRFDAAVMACEEGLSNAVGEKKSVTEQLHEAQSEVFHERLKGKWRGTVSEEMGAYEQEMEFHRPGRKLTVHVMGRTVPCEYTTDLTQTPIHMDTKIVDPTMPSPAAPVTDIQSNCGVRSYSFTPLFPFTRDCLCPVSTSTATTTHPVQSIPVQVS